MISENTKKNIYIIATFVFVYVVLFEFILPVNKVLPKPTIVWESLVHLWDYYSFGKILFATIGLVYFSMLTGYGIIWLFRGIILKYLVIWENTFQVFKAVKYIPFFFIIIFFTFWFESSIIAQFVFLILFFCLSIIDKILLSVSLVKEEYILVAKNIRPHKIYSHVYWNSILPELFRTFKLIHVEIWVLALIYEFVSDTYGIGQLIKEIITYKDFGAFISVVIILCIVFTISNLLIKFLKNKYANWDC